MNYPIGIESHKVRLEVEMARTPWAGPDAARRLGGHYQIPAEPFYGMLSSRDRYVDGRRAALEAILHGLERVVQSTGDAIRKEWNMETRQEETKRLAEERRYSQIHRMFVTDALGALDSKPLPPWLVPTRVPESEDWPLLGEVLG